MKINSQRYPILGADLSPFFSGQYLEMFRKAQKKPYYIVSNLFEAIELSYDKLKHLLFEIEDVSRLVLTEKYSVIYDLMYSGDQNSIIFTGAVVKANKINRFQFAVEKADDNEIFYKGGFVGEQRLNEDVISSGLTTMLAIELFIQAAEIETKVVQPKSKIMSGLTCLYKNETSNPVQVIDSTWFTNIIRTEGFKVRGHFRLQPFGEGMKKRKLVWISEFQKNGYTIKAKKQEFQD